MASSRGVQVRHDGGTWLYTTSAKAEQDLKGLEVLADQMRKRADSMAERVEKVRAAMVEMREREAAGKARRPARKVEAA